MGEQIYIVANEPETVGGVQRVIETLARGFTGAGHTVVVVSAKSRKPAIPAPFGRDTALLRLFPNSALPKFVTDKLTSRGMALERLNILGQRKFVSRLSALVRDRPGAIIAMDVFAGQLVSRVPRRFARTRIIQFHNSFDALNGTRDMRRLVSASKSFDAFLALTQPDADKFAPAMKTSTRAMPNPIPFAPSPWTADRSQKILSVGRLVPHKGFGLLVEAWSHVPSDFRQEWSLEIIGSGPDETSLRAQIAALQLGGSVVLRGESTDIQSDLLDAQLLVLASEYEGLPMVLLEAMSQSVVCVATNSSVGVESLLTGERGALVPVGDSVALANALVAMMKDPELRERTANLGRESVERFALNLIVQKWTALFEQGSTRS